MKAHHPNPTKVVLISIIITILLFLLGSQSIFAQQRTPNYIGFEGSFGTRTFTVSSNIEQLQNLSVLQQGGNLGIVFGNQFLLTRIGLAGFYYSSDNTVRTVDLYEGDISMNVYPLSRLNLTNHERKLRPYLTTGIVYDRVKFFGHYLEDNGRYNYSSNEPLIGVINQVRAAIGTGVEIKLLNNYDFLHLFAEVRYGFNIGDNKSTSVLSGTSLSNQITINLGMRFGKFN